METSELRSHLLAGQAIPAPQLALDASQNWSLPNQHAVGVHSKQFEIREPHHALFGPLLSFASAEIDSWLGGSRPFAKITGLCGDTAQACGKAALARQCGYHAGLLSLAALKHATLDELVAHCRIVFEVFPIIGFYLRPAVGGGVLPYEFWQKFAKIPKVAAIKIAPFNRYQTFDVIRAVVEAGRDDIALYTGNEDNIAVDLLTPWEIGGKRRFIVGGLLGQFGVWTMRAVELMEEIKAVRKQEDIPAAWLSRNAFRRRK